MSNKGLGRGFEVLIPLDVNVANITANSQEKVHKLAIDIVVPNINQPRKQFDDESLKELAQSIVEHGIIQPIIVDKIEQNLYSIIAGERRWRAAKIAGLKEVPAIVRSANDHERLELALLENVQRTDLTPLELANTIFKLHTQFSQGYEDIARRLGKAQTTIINNIRLLNLPPVMQESLQNGNITEGHARALLSLQKYPEAQKNLFASIISKGWNVRQAEQYAVSIKKGQIVTTKNYSTNSTVEAITNKIQKKLNAKKVYVQSSAKGSGKLVITYSTEQEFAKIVGQILSN